MNGVSFYSKPGEQRTAEEALADAAEAQRKVRELVERKRAEKRQKDA